MVSQPCVCRWATGYSMGTHHMLRVSSMSIKHLNGLSAITSGSCWIYTLHREARMVMIIAAELAIWLGVPQRIVRGACSPLSDLRNDIAGDLDCWVSSF